MNKNKHTTENPNDVYRTLIWVTVESDMFRLQQGGRKLEDPLEN